MKIILILAAVSSLFVASSATLKNVTDAEIDALVSLTLTDANREKFAEDALKALLQREVENRLLISITKGRVDIINSMLPVLLTSCESSKNDSRTNDLKFLIESVLIPLLLRKTQCLSPIHQGGYAVPNQFRPTENGVVIEIQGSNGQVPFPGQHASSLKAPEDSSKQPSTPFDPAQPRHNLQFPANYPYAYTIPLRK
ncbi:unnamed protein product [Caenorhabditis sp. 36 PRJEB53466]|nr:unnamed protein product [Caenorhabditis sp. 36 PRJEB53466]